ncbi:MAG TPA: SDR family oxidoreductase [Acidimicrobiales bacterium]|jgi:NAD(P)-dependent dehydrogenase (short-subunit alcohol dehydrogenase family)
MAKVVLITGASAGIGQATADRLHGAGWRVVGASRRGTSSGGWQAMKMDVDDDDDTRRGVAAVLSEHGRLDAVVASAGWGLAGPVELTPIDRAKAQVETNFWGVVRVVQHALPAMRAQQSGRLVLVSSIGGLIALPFQAFYSASKYALEGYAEGLAYEVDPFGIHVTLVEPGNIRTDFTASRHTISDDPDGVYRAAADKAITLMEKDESNGAPPASAAAVIARVLEAKRPRRRVSVGKVGERIGIPAKRLLPHRVFEKAAGSSLGV